MDFFLPLPTTERKQKGGLHSLQPDTLYWYRCSKNIAHFHQGINLARRGVFYEARLLCVGWLRGVSLCLWLGDSLTETGCCRKSSIFRTHAGGMITEVTLVTEHRGCCFWRWESKLTRKQQAIDSNKIWCGGQYQCTIVSGLFLWVFTGQWHREGVHGHSRCQALLDPVALL